MDRVIFLDRDGTIIKDKHYIFDPKDIEFLPSAIEGLKKFQETGFKFIIISNQAGIARGYFDVETANRFNKELISKLAKHDIRIERIYICPHHPEFTGPCLCRKPEPGLAKLAAKELNIDLKKSYFIGDKDCDTELGKNCGGRTFLIKNNQYNTTIMPDYKIKNLLEAADIIKALKSA